MSGRSRSSAVRHYRSGMPVRLIRAIAIATLLGSQFPFIPTVSAAQSTTQSPPAEPVAVSTGGPADPIPYVYPDDAGGGGGGGTSLASDPSIGQRPVFGPSSRPKAATAVQDKWSADMQVWQNTNGTYTVDAGHNLNFKNAGGAWTAFDLSLVQGDKGFAPAAAPTQLQLNTNAVDGTLASLKGDDATISLRLATPSIGTKDPTNSRLDFASAPGFPTAFVKPTDTGFEFGATFADATVVPHADFILDAGGLVATIAKDGYSIDLAKPDALDTPIGQIGMPVFKDANDFADQSDVSVTLSALPDGTYLLSYGIDPAWLGAKERAFPVTLDPTACIRYGGGTSCDINTSSTHYLDTYIADGLPNNYPTTPSWDRVGWDVIGSPDAVWNQMRSLLYFDGTTLPDGAMVTGATLNMVQEVNRSAGTVATLTARMITAGWGSTATWNQMNAKVNSAYDSPAASLCGTGTTRCNDGIDVTKAVRAWYTRRGPDWKPNIGFQVKYTTEGSSSNYYETDFDNMYASGYRPLLVITYEVPAFQLSFASELGPTYAPSTMIAGQGNLVPISVKNDSNYTWDTTNYRIGYRWYDTKGNVVGSPGLITLTSAVGSGATYTPNPAPSITPPGLGQYTLRFDIVKVVSGVNLFASDWAQPSTYYSRNKKILTSDSTRWTGSSPIERDEFGITVINGQGAGGTEKDVATGDGGQVGINLWSKNLRYSANTGLGFSDRLPVTLTYGYNSKDAATCSGYQGVLGACGWFTNYDERVTAGSSSGDFTYYDPNGNATYIDSDQSGQLIGAPVQLSRIRATLFDENEPTSGGTLVTAASQGIPANSGLSVVRVPANADAILGGFTPNGAEVSLNTYRQISFALYNTNAASTAICFEIDDHTTNTAGHWICLEAGPSFSTGNQDYSWPGDVVLHQWSNHQNDIWSLVRSNSVFGSPNDDYYVKTVKIKSSSGSNTGYTYVDNVVMTQRRIWAMVSGSMPSWTSGSSVANWNEYVDQMSSQIATSATCTGTCYSGLADSGAELDSLQAAPFARWWWKKAGGTSVSMTFTFKDLRTNATVSITYYAGALPTGANPATSVQISPTLPGHFTRVTRNIEQDARQILNFYNDSPTGTTSTSPPTQGPTPDSVQLTGFTAAAVDGQYMLLEKLEQFSGPEWATSNTLNRYADHLSQIFFDFEAEYPDGTTHYFNRDGLLTSIMDRDGNRTTLDWTYNASLSGQPAYSLAAIHGAGDGTVNGGTTYSRQIDVTRSSPSGFNQLTFTESLGATGSTTGRRADFYVANATGTSWGSQDLVKVSPARNNSSTCGSAPSGCDEFDYTSTTSHLLYHAADPRKDGTTDARLEVTWSSGNPVAILDKAHGNAPLLKIITFDRGRTNSPNYLRPLYQDAAAAAAAYAIHLDLTPEGSVQTEYVRQGPCASNDCSTNMPADDATTLGARKAVSYAFDGLNGVSTITTYRCPGVALDGCTGTTALASTTRRGSRAGAKVDNYPDALAATETEWTQSADQYFASMRDSGGVNQDLYRTVYLYNGVHNPIVVTSAVTARVVDYPGTTASLGGLVDYWRLGETSGTFANSVAGGPSATGVSVTYGKLGALARDPNTAVGFNGSTSQITSTATVNTTGYTIEAWVNSGSQGQLSKAIAGRWLTNSGVRLLVDSNGDFAFGHNAYVISSNIVPAAGRWYYVVGTWDGAQMVLYVDGALVASGAATGNTGAGSSAFEIGSNSNGNSSTFFNGSIDEVAVRSAAIGQPAVQASYESGRGIAINRVETTYGWTDPTAVVHLDANPTESATQLISNGDFSSGLASWNITGTATYAAVNTLELPTSTTADQVAQLLPGQRVHFQVNERTDGTAGSTARVRLSYWQISTGGWVDLVDDSLPNTTTWTDRAFEYTIPATDTTGLVRVSLSDGSGVGQAWFDSVLLVTAWQAITYRPHTNFGASGTSVYLQDGLPETTTSFAASAAVRLDKLVYGATSANPAIFPTTAIANYLDGTQGPGPEEDVTTTTTYDTWGRTLSITDPDNVVTTSVYDAGNMTDVVQTKDGLNNATTYTYDLVGNKLSTTTPLGRVTSATYDTRNHLLTSTAPDGVVSRTDYDNYGRVTASWANYTTGTPGADHDVLTTYAYDGYGRVIQKDAECGSVATCATGGLDARTTTSYDLLGNVAATTVYPGPAGTGTARVTTNFFETYAPPSGTQFYPTTFGRTAASGVQMPIAPSASPAPLCPGAATAYCNSASVWKLNGSWVSAVDMNGRAFGSTDAYGIVTITDADVAGRPVITTAHYDASLGSSSDTNVVTRTEYDLAGDPIVSWDPMNRRVSRLYDGLGRVLETDQLDSTGTRYAFTSTQYKFSGRVDRAFDGSAWTQTLYDGAGRAIKTIANWDQNGTAGMTLDAMEGTVGNWSIGSSGFFTTSAASSKTDDTDTAGNEYTKVAPLSGAGRLHITTHATNTNDGVWLDLTTPGVTYKSGHLYKAAFDLQTDTAQSLTAYLGQDSSGGSYGSLAISSTTAWTRYTVSWTAGSDLTSAIHFAVTKVAAGTSQLYLDNLVVWDTSQPDKGIVSSATTYNADGEIIASVLPPGDPTTDRPLVTTVAFDPAGRTVESVTNGSSGGYAATILGTANLTAYFPLNERLGITTADKTGGNPLVSSAIPTLGIAGGIDEARTATRFTGSNGFLSRGSNATSNTTNVSMEAWIRTDTTPSGTVIVASNGSSTDSWGIAIDASGNAAGFTQKSTNPHLGFTTLSSTKVVTDGAWHHLVLTRGASTWKITVDGTSQSVSNSSQDPGTPGAGFTIGAWSDASRPYVGEVDEVSVYTADISGSTAAAHWAAGRQTNTTTALTTRNAYDRLGRVTDAWAPDLVRTKAVHDRLGNQTDTWANYRDGVTTGGTADDDVHSTYAYDVMREQVGYCPAVQVNTTTCDPTSSSNSQAWHYVFDAMGRQTKTIPPVNTSLTALTTTETVYETGGRVAQTCQYTAGASCGSTFSRHVDYTYDNLGRPLTKKTWDRTSGSDTLKFTKTLTWNADGTPASVSEGTSALSYVYDNAGRLSQFKNGATIVTAYTYTPDTNTIATRTDGTQGATTFTYDWARRETVIDPPDSYVTGTVTRTYRLDGLLATQSFPSSITETLGYDEDKRPTSISLGSAGSLSQTFDRAGRATSDGRSLTGISGDAGTNTQSFTYDNLSRLTGSTGLAVSRSYAYDLDGNRTSRVEGSTTTAFTYDRTDETINQTIGATTKTYTYDMYGNLTTSADNASAVTTYAYDEASRLTTINPPSGGQITFAIDALDRNLSRSIGGTLNDTYAYIGSQDVTWQTGNATPTSGLLDADGSRLAVKTNSTVSWLVFDLHGSVAALCPAGTSTLSDAYRYDGFGQQIASSGSSTNAWRYRGLLNIGNNWDIGALYDMGARDYSAQLGQFTHEDSVQGSAANPMSMNRFLYALADPATLIDRTGHFAVRSTDTGGAGCSYFDDACQVGTQHVVVSGGTVSCTSSGCHGGTSSSAGGTASGSSGATAFGPGYSWSSSEVSGHHILLGPGCSESSDGYFNGCSAQVQLPNPLQTRTAGVCFGSAIGIGIYVNESVCRVTDINGKSATLLTNGIDLHAGGGAELSFGYFESTSEHVSEQGGGATDVGWGTEIGPVGVGATSSSDSGDSGAGYNTTEYEASVGAGLGLGPTFGFSNTMVIEDDQLHPH